MSLSDRLSRGSRTTERGQILDWLGRAFDPVQAFAMFGRRAELFAQVLDAAELGPRDVQLDIGCGTGTLLQAAAERADGSCVLVGLEPARSLIVQAWPKLEPASRRALLVRGYAQQLPFADESFDVVSATEMLHHLPSLSVLEQVLGEAHRVLRGGGRFVALDFWPPGSRLGKLLHFHFRWNLLEESAFFYRGELPALLRSLGFESPRVTPRKYLPNAIYRAQKPGSGIP